MISMKSKEKTNQTIKFFDEDHSKNNSSKQLQTVHLDFKETEPGENSL
jgi:hypothetical protein